MSEPLRLLEDKVAVVSGAGSGLGKGISLGLLGAGARVGLVDISAERASQTEAQATQTHGPDRAVALTGDVTDETAVRRVFDQAIERFDRVDILVNAAGIAPSHPLVDFPVDAWRKSLEINLTGYFLMAREAARLMIRQGHGGSIVNLTSKTGLDASRNNSAYNATKSAEIHLARGWALELGPHQIRVNAVAPGNVFEGSMIWNPEYIKDRAAAKGIKPEEVIPHYVGLTALGLDIKPQDVANVVIWLSSDLARTITGQTIVCDAGQVFVR